MKQVAFLFAIICVFQLRYGICQSADTGNIPFATAGLVKLPTGPSVAGVFDGRIPCGQFGKAYGWTAPSNCTKLKMRIILFQHPVTKQPTTFILQGTLNRDKDYEGKWAIIKGMPADDEAIIYQLDSDNPDKSIFLLKGDENVLFILDRSKNFLVGNEQFSFTLNRARQ